MFNIKILKKKKFHLDYEKVFIQMVYISHAVQRKHEERGRPKSFISKSRLQLQRDTQPDLWFAPTSNPTCLFWFQNLILLKSKIYNILIIASASHIRTRVINFYFPTPVDKPWFVYYPYPVFPNFILMWGV